MLGLGIGWAILGTARCRGTGGIWLSRGLRKGLLFEFGSKGLATTPAIAGLGHG